MNFNLCFRTSCFDLGHEPPTTAVTKRSVMWDITLCSPLVYKRRFGGKYILPIQVGSWSQERKQLCFVTALLQFLAWLLQGVWRYRRQFPPKCILIFHISIGVVCLMLTFFSCFLCLGGRRTWTEDGILCRRIWPRDDRRWSPIKVHNKDFHNLCPLPGAVTAIKSVRTEWAGGKELA